MSDNIIEFIKSDIVAIKRYDKDIASTYVYISRRLYELKQSGYIEKSNFKEYKNIYDLSLHEFGYEKAKTNYLLLIYEKFFKSYLINHKKSIYDDYSISQLRYMLDMSDEQLKQCSSNMTVKQIKQIKINLSTRVDNESIENTENLENFIHGQNIITGVFPDKKEDVKQEQVKTIIVSEMPIAAPVSPIETKTITTVTETVIENNQNDYEVQLKKYKEQLELNLNEFNRVYKDYLNYQKDISVYKDMINYIYDDLYNINNPLQHEKIEKLLNEIYDFNKNNKLPEKVKFFQSVI